MLRAGGQEFRLLTSRDGPSTDPSVRVARRHPSAKKARVALFPDSTDRQFLRFCRTGDASALGQVFDATAHELLRIACHLAGNRTDAEDLVQRTFLAVIESRAAYEPKGRALPWLIGILANHARRLRRERRRPASACAPATSDPSALAAERELDERLARLRADLGEPYGEVLRLHLEQGLSAKEIAQALQRPAGTVRTQLVRALALLRQRLPDGFVAALVPFSAPPAPVVSGALGALRHTVLRSVPPSVGANVVVPLSVTGGWFVGKKLVLIASLFVALVSLTLHVVWQPAAAASPAVPETAVGPRVAADEHTLRAPSAEPRDPERMAVPAGTVLAVGEPGFAVVRVHVRWRNDGGPAAGVGVFAANGRDIARRDAVTDDAGNGELPHLVPGTWSIGNALGEQPTELVLQAGQVANVEVFAERRATAHGRVVDAHDRPVADARIWLSIGVDQSHGHEVARSDAAGAFVVPIRARHLIGARKAGSAPSRCVAVDVAEPESLSLVLRLEHAGGTVAGFVQDPTGVPIAWAKVLFGDEATSMAPVDGGREFPSRGVEVATDARGAFRVDGVPAGIDEVRAWAPGHAPFVGSVEVPAAGLAELRITLLPGAIVSGVVRDQAGGPVAGATLAWGTDHGFAHRAALSAADGTYLLDDLPASAITLVAERGTAHRAARVTTTAGAIATWDPVLAQGLPLGGRVVGPRDEPLHGLVVMGQNGGVPFHAVTDAAGRFWLADAGTVPVALEVASEQSLLQLAGVAPGTVDLVLRLGEDRLPSAFLCGRLVDEHGRPVAAQLGPAHPDSLRVHFHKSDPATGTFRIGPLRPGPYRLDGESPTLGERLLASPSLAPGQTLDLGDVLFSTPGTALVRVSANGRPVATGDVRFRMLGMRWFAGAAIENGEVRHARLPPGTYCCSADGMGMVGSALVQVVAGGIAEVSLELRPALRVTVVLRDPRRGSLEDLAPVLEVREIDGPFVACHDEPSAVRGEGGGFAFVDLLPVGRYRITATVRDGRTAVGELDVRANTEVGVGCTIDLPR